MQQCTETITVLNRKYDTSTGRDVWTATAISGVSWHSSINATVTQNGLKSAVTATVRIPVSANASGKSYMTPAEYKAALDTSGAYTLARGDVIVRGTVTGNPTPAEAQAAAEDSITIIGVTDNTRRPHGPHRKVVGA